MRVPKVLAWLLAIGVLGGGLVALWQAYSSFPTSSAPSQSGWVSTETGPLGPGDRDLIVRVRLAGLWEGPVGRQLSERAVQPRVKEIGGFLFDEHHDLDEKVGAIAKQLGVELPTQPTEEQQGWMSEIDSQSGSNFDVIAVNRLRQAHGAILPAIATIKANTRNSAVRAFADEAFTYVSRHMGYLESTGLVNFDDLPEPPSPTRSVVTKSGNYEQVPIALGALGVVLVLSIVIWFSVSAMRRRSAQRIYDAPIRTVPIPSAPKGPEPPTAALTTPYPQLKIDDHGGRHARVDPPTRENQ